MDPLLPTVDLLPGVGLMRLLMGVLVSWRHPVRVGCRPDGAPVAEEPEHEQAESGRLLRPLGRFCFGLMATGDVVVPSCVAPPVVRPPSHPVECIGHRRLPAVAQWRSGAAAQRRSGAVAQRRHQLGPEVPVRTRPAGGRSTPWGRREGRQCAWVGCQAPRRVLTPGGPAWRTAYV